MNFSLPIFSYSFPPELNDIAHSGRESFSLGDILRAAILCGRHRSSGGRSGYNSWVETQWRIYTIKASLDLASPPTSFPNTYIRRNPIVERMDGSEKNVLSYFVGNLVTKLISERRFQAPLLLHHDIYRRFLRTPLSNSHLRPDFVGWSQRVRILSSQNSPWFTIESKGRTRRLSSKARLRAKVQAESLAYVRGQPTSFHAVISSFFSSNVLHSEMFDPEPSENINLDVSLSDFAKEYYRPLEYLINQRRRIHLDKEELIIDAPELDLKILLHPWLAKWLHRERDDDTSLENLLVDPSISYEGFQYGVAVIPGPSWGEQYGSLT